MGFTMSLVPPAARVRVCRHSPFFYAVREGKAGKDKAKTAHTATPYYIPKRSPSTQRLCYPSINPRLAYHDGDGSCTVHIRDFQIGKAAQSLQHSRQRAIDFRAKGTREMAIA